MNIKDSIVCRLIPFLLTLVIIAGGFLVSFKNSNGNIPRYLFCTISSAAIAFLFGAWISIITFLSDNKDSIKNFEIIPIVMVLGGIISLIFGWCWLTLG